MTETTHTPDLEAADGMDPFEVIGAFVDGEPVGPAALRQALSSAEGRQYLTDIVALREFASEHALPSPDFVEVRTPAPMSWVRRLTVAAAIVVSIGGGYLAGHRTGTSDAREDSPAAVGAVSRGASEAIVAPAPTLVIKLQPGVDWNESKGRP